MKVKCLLIGVVAVLMALMMTGVASADIISQTVLVTVNVPPYLEVSTSELAPSRNQGMVMEGIPPIIIDAVPDIESLGITEFVITANTVGFIAISGIVQPKGLSGLTAILNTDRFLVGITNILLTASIIVPKEQLAGTYTDGTITITATTGY